MRYAKLQILATPLKAPVIAAHPFWHDRFHQDPANLWLRQRVRDEFRADRRDTSTPIPLPTTARRHER